MHGHAQRAQRHGQSHGHLSTAAGGHRQRNADVGGVVQVAGHCTARNDLTDEQCLHRDAAEHTGLHIAHDEADDGTRHQRTADRIEAAGGTEQPGYLISTKVREDANE